MNLPEQDNIQAPAIHGSLPGNPAPAAGAPASPAFTPPRAKPGFFGIWANPKKCDTSAWNIYYYYYRQIAQHMPSCKLKFLKWIALGINVVFFGFPLLDSLGKTKTFVRSFHNINVTLYYILVVLLTFVPPVMLGNAFKLKMKNAGFMTSRGKESPLLLHLAEYTSCDRLISGVLQSLIYTYSLFLLYLLPAILAYFALENYNHKLSSSDILAIPVSMLIVNFLVMQKFCFRLDTLIITVLFIIELICDLSGGFALKFLFGNGSDDIFMRSPWFALLFWAVTMVYIPLAAADTLDYGVGGNALRIRLLQIGIILVNLGSLVFRACFLVPPSEWNSSFSALAIQPGLWIMLGFIGMLCSSLAAASFRAKACFIKKIVVGQKYLPRFLNPASPCYVLTVCVLEIAVAAFFIGLPWARSRGFWSSSLTEFGHDADFVDARYMLMTALMILSSLHFSLAILYHFRRRSHTDKKPWKTNAGLNGLFFVFLIAFLLLFVFASSLTLNGNDLSVLRLLPMFYYPVSVFCLVMSAVRESGEIRAAKQAAGYGHDVPQVTQEGAR